MEKNTHVDSQNPTKLTHWKKEFNPDFLGSWSLDGGEDIVLTIKKTGRTKVKSQQNPKGEDCFAAWFKETDKPMILNVTNCRIIGKLYSNYIETWIGKKIQLYVKEVSAFGEVVEALRIKEVVPVSKSEIDDAKKKIDAAKSNEELVKLYNTNQDWQKNQPIMSLFTARKKQIQDELIGAK